MSLSDLAPSTDRRVPRHSAAAANARIRAEMLERLRHYENADAARISARISELEREWDIERVLEANAAGVALLGLTLGATVNRRWFALPAVVAAFLLQHAIQGWCPPLPVFRRLGVRTAAEIHEEIIALKMLRGDFGSEERTAAVAAERARLH
jgi:hypothetical protein